MPSIADRYTALRSTIQAFPEQNFRRALAAELPTLELDYEAWEQGRMPESHISLRLETMEATIELASALNHIKDCSERAQRAGLIPLGARVNPLPPPSSDAN